MAKYEVIKDFSDLKDRNHIYRAGDPFPREGKKVTDERIEELLSADNKRKEALIEEVQEGQEEQDEDGVPPEFPVHTGGGYFELSNGNKVQGKEAAAEAEEALKE